MQGIWDSVKDTTTRATDGVVSGVNSVGSAAYKVPGVNFVADGVGSVTDGLSSSFKTMYVLNADTKARVVVLSPLIVTKVGRIITAMQQSTFHFTDDEIDLVVKAVYVSRSDEDLKKAFDMLDSRLNDGAAQGHLRDTEFKTILPLVGENIPPEKIEELFKQVDTDGSGAIEFEEFKTLMLAMNPVEPKEEGFNIPGASSVMGGFSAFTSGISDNYATMSVLSASTQSKLLTASPMAMTKVGRVIKRMQQSEFQFSDAEVDLVVKALYVTQADDDFRKVFEMFDSKLNGGATQGFLTAETFKKVLPLLGEDVPPEKIEELFAQVDTDGSGNIEFDEFKELMLGMNPKN